MDELIFLTPKSLSELRERQYKKQKKRCAILQIEIDLEDATLDHKHKTKAQECGGPEGLGCCRGILHNNVNVFEGKVERLYKRFGLSNLIDLPTLLRRCADYIENPPMEKKYVHIHSKPKRKKLTMQEYKRICKYYFDIFPTRRKLPKYPKDKIKSERWEEMLRLVENFKNRNKRIKRIRSSF